MIGPEKRPSPDGFIEEPDTHQLILVVDDQLDHLEIIEQVLTDKNEPYAEHCKIITLSTTAESIDFLRRRGAYAAVQRPDLVLMNMHLADKQAHTILSEIKTDPALRQIPTIVLTASASDDDILNSYRQRCNCFVLKPQDLNQLDSTLKVIKSFWLNLVTLPLK